MTGVKGRLKLLNVIMIGSTFKSGRTAQEKGINDMLC